MNDGMTHEDPTYSLIGYLTSLSRLFQLLSAGLFRPTPEFVEAYASGAYRTDLAALLEPSMDADLEVAVEALAPEELMTETDPALLAHMKQRMEVVYNRVFVGPGHILVSPYASSHRATEDGEKHMMSRITSRVAKEYDRAGLAPRLGVNDHPDHIATELSFVSVLADRISRTKDELTAAADLEILERFMVEHLSTWTRSLHEEVAAHEPESYLAPLTYITWRVTQSS